MDRTPRQVAVLRRLGIISVDEVVEWAVRSAKSDKTPSLLIEITSLPEPYRAIDVDSFLIEHLAETGEHLGTPEEVAIEAGRIIAQDIVGGCLSPAEGARVIWSKIARSSPQPVASLVRFGGLLSEMDDHPNYRNEYEQDIVAEARGLLATTRE